MNQEKIFKLAEEVISLEVKGVLNLKNILNKDFIRAVELMLNCKGNILVTGLGKSGIIAKKIAATLTSTGTPSIYLHPAESLHGDLGMVQAKDVVLAISKSGQTEELSILIPFFKRRNIPIVSITANPDSELARESKVCLHMKIDKEACPHDLAPTVSTTTALVLGDALAIVLMSLKGFRADDFLAFHPGGAIGKKFWLKVEDMMLQGPKYVPVVHLDTPMKDVILEMTTKRGITSVIDNNDLVVGVITDGDLRRLLEKTEHIFSLTAKDVMSINPKTIDKDTLAVVAAQKMENHGITALIVVDKDNKPIGIIHLHDLMRERVI